MANTRTNSLQPTKAFHWTSKHKDCCRLHIIFHKTSSLRTQWMTWSEYKHSNTLKILIGVTPNGMVTFVSRLWAGNVSDRHIVPHGEFLPKLCPGDVIMAENGLFRTNSNASVEMKMEQIKNCNIVTSRILLSEVHLSEQIICICTALTNLLPPLLS